jgi:hypothetical protein
MGSTEVEVRPVPHSHIRLDFNFQGTLHASKWASTGRCGFNTAVFKRYKLWASRTFYRLASGACIDDFTRSSQCPGHRDLGAHGGPSESVYTAVQGFHDLEHFIDWGLFNRTSSHFKHFCFDWMERHELPSRTFFS